MKVTTDLLYVCFIGENKSWPLLDAREAGQISPSDNSTLPKGEHKHYFGKPSMLWCLTSINPGSLINS